MPADTAPAEPTPAERHASPLLLIVVALVAIAGVAAVWSGLSLLLRSTCAWMTVVTALDAALLLRLASAPPGRTRAGWAVGITLATVCVAAYVVAAAQIGLLMGFRPADAIWKISPGLAWLYTTSNVAWFDGIWLAAALALAWRAGR